MFLSSQLIEFFYHNLNLKRGKIKRESRVTSSNPRVASSNPRVTSSNVQVTS